MEEYLQSLVPERFLTDERYRRGHLNVIAPAPGTRVLGMHTPEMKKVAKELAGSAWQETLVAWAAHNPLKGKGGLTHEERMIWGLTIDYAKMPLEQRLRLLDEFIPAIDNWAICDNLCCNAKWIEKEDKEAVWRFLREQIRSTDEFRSRVGLIMALAHFLDTEEHAARTLETVAMRAYADDDPYYIRMGAAWLFAEGLCKHYDMALEYILDRRLCRWIHNKSIQKARESYRITPEQKSYLRTLKY